MKMVETIVKPERKNGIILFYSVWNFGSVCAGIITGDGEYVPAWKRMDGDWR